jgi:hypothetical protein
LDPGWGAGGGRRAHEPGNLIIKFKTSPKSDHVCTAFPSKIRDFTNFAKPIKKSNRFPWNDAKTTYESLREECDFVIEEAGQGKRNQQLEKLYGKGSVAVALAATPEEKAKLLCLYVCDGKPCPNARAANTATK